MNDNVVTEEMVNRDNSNVVLKPKFIPLYIESLEMWLSLIEASIYWFVEFFLSTNKHFYCTNEQIAKMLCVWVTSVSKAIIRLNELWLIYTDYRIKSWWGKIRFIKLLKNVEGINKRNQQQSVEEDNIENVNITDNERIQNIKSEDKAENKEVVDKPQQEVENKKKKYWEYVELSDKEYMKLISFYWETRFEEKWGETRLKVHSQIVDNEIIKINKWISDKVKFYKETWKKTSKSKYALWYKDYYIALMDRFDREKRIKFFGEMTDEDAYKLLLSDKSWRLVVRFIKQFGKSKLKDLIWLYANSLWEIEMWYSNRLSSEWIKVYAYENNDWIVYDTNRERYETDGYDI